MSSFFSFRTARLITCHFTATGRSFSTSSIQRLVIHAHGHSGSNQKSTSVGSCSAIHAPKRSSGTPTGQPEGGSRHSARRDAPSGTQGTASWRRGREVNRDGEQPDARRGAGQSPAAERSVL